MRRICTQFSVRTVLVGLLLLASGAGAETLDPSGDGSLLLRHRMQDLAGRQVDLSAFRGEVLVVNFWASWCAPCRRELPVLDAWNTAWRDRDARVVAISIDSRARKARRFVAEAGLDLTVWIDGPDGLAARLDLPAVPTSYVIDRDGQVVLRITGSSDADLDRMHTAVENLLRQGNRRPDA